MSGFPKLPLVHGDTDDDISIHLRRQIGPAVPLREKKGERDGEILQILNDAKGKSYNTDFNRYFKVFQETGRIPERFGDSDGSDESGSESDIDEPQTEKEIRRRGRHEMGNDSDEDIKDRSTPHEFSDDEGTYVREEDIEEDKEEEPKPAAHKGLFEQFKKLREEGDGENVISSSRSLFKSAINSFWFSFAITNVLFMCFFAYRDGLSYRHKKVEPYTPHIGSSDDLISEVQGVKTNLGNLATYVNRISERQDDLQNNYEVLSANVVKKLEKTDQRFTEISKEMNQNRHWQELKRDFDAIKKQVDNFQLEANPGPKIEEISEKLEKLSSVNDEISQIKNTIVTELLNSLPEHVPVYIKNKKVHFIPEFHKYLYNFVENFNKERGSVISWDTFIKDNEPRLNEYVSAAFNKSSSGLRLLNKDAIENALSRKLNENNKMMWQKFNNLVDNLNLLNTSTSNGVNHFDKFANEILLNNMLEIFAKGSIKVNYADYSLGSRILGFLTTTYPDNAKSLSRRLFLGWYDYLRGSGLTSPKYWKYNANNLLLDNSDTWECDADKCSVGVRLFRPVIITDIILKTDEDDLSENPTMASIYIKPQSFSNYNELIKHLNQFKYKFSSVSDGKYLKKFVKVKEVSLNSNKIVNHIKLPLSLINMRIPTKDLYVEFISPKGKVVLNSIKAYGISELNAYKYNEEFSLILDKIYDEDVAASEHASTEYYDQLHENHGIEEVLGDDEILF